MPEVDLAAAVIHRALEDAIVPDDRLARPRFINTRTGTKRVFMPGLTPRDWEEAVRFLLDTAPGWASSREAWCDAAGLDANVVQRHGLRRIPHTSIPVDVCRALRLPLATPDTAPVAVLYTRFCELSGFRFGLKRDSKLPFGGGYGCVGPSDPE